MLIADSLTFTVTKIEFTANWRAIGVTIGITVIAGILFYLSFRKKN
jgi:hypothetical protein